MDCTTFLYVVQAVELVLAVAFRNKLLVPVDFVSSCRTVVACSNRFVYSESELSYVAVAGFALDGSFVCGVNRILINACCVSSNS